MKRAWIYFLLPCIALCLDACTTTKPGLLSSGISLREKGPAALEQALADADKASASGLTTDEAKRAYSEAVERAVTLWLGLSDAKNRANSMLAGTSYRVQPSWPANLRFDELIPAHTIKSKHLKRRITREGVGVPYVTRWNYTPERKKTEPLMTEGGYFSTITATIDFRSAGKGPRVASLVLHDSRGIETVTLAGRRQPLAADFSAYGELILSSKNIQMAGIKALLRSSKYMSKLGLIAMEHPDAERIPVVFVHGLMSRPATWENAINELGADPVLQKRYQVYMFRYPSGVPVVYSSAKLRENLAVLHDVLEKQGKGWLHHHMVLIGHSMGGLVSKGQIQDSGDRLWVTLLGDTPDKIGLSQTEYDALRNYMEFDPNPSVSRVIFAATPHRGSNMADSKLAHIGRRLVSLPGRTFGNTFDILEDIATRNPQFGRLFANGMPTSVDNLSPESPYVKISTSLPFRPDVRLHSIIGNKEGRPLTDPKCSDGVVPYTSAHLEGVKSEIVVRSGHGVHEKPEAIEEMRRILRLHLKELNLN
jgi:pimeloyl-ACP methyl ester carboxylesterase